MKNTIDRRCFLKTTGALGAGITMAGLDASDSSAAEQAKGAPHAEKLGWVLCCGAYSFNQLTFVETLDKIAALGLHSVEAFEWQKLSPQKPDVQTNAAMSAADRKETKQRLADAGIKMDAIYCSKLAEEAASRKSFEFAKEMGISVLIAEPPFEAYDMLEKLCDEYQINLAVHNHPAPSQYYDPKTILKLSKGRSKRIGACCDTGHWVRSSFQPVEALKMLQGRIISFHLKDVDQFGVKSAECVPWGTGKGDVEGILKEMHRQGFKGIFTIEYEPYRPENFPKIAQCVAFFDKIAAELGG